MTRPRGLNFNLVSEVKLKEIGTSPIGRITYWDVRVTEVRLWHPVSLECVEPRILDCIWLCLALGEPPYLGGRLHP